jgi:hypothetical protein
MQVEVNTGSGTDSSDDEPKTTAGRAPVLPPRPAVGPRSTSSTCVAAHTPFILTLLAVSVLDCVSCWLTAAGMRLDCRSKLGLSLTADSFKGRVVTVGSVLGRSAMDRTKSEEEIFSKIRAMQESASMLQ